MVSPLDILLFTAQVMEGRGLTPLQQRTAVAIIAALAQWDPEVSVTLADLDLERLDSPVSVLSELATQRGWDPNEPLTEIERWQRGMCDLVEGRAVEHAALLAVRGDERALNRRIWSGQVGVVLPWIEECRRNLLDRYEGAFRAGWVRPSGECIEDVLDLEIGDIYAQLRAGVLSVGRAELERVRRLRDLRNALAHLEPLPASALRRDLHE
jgi:hypothetical protein